MKEDWWQFVSMFRALISALLTTPGFNRCSFGERYSWFNIHHIFSGIKMLELLQGNGRPTSSIMHIADLQ
jgi:hypothetical protein